MLWKDCKHDPNFDVLSDSFVLRASRAVDIMHRNEILFFQLYHYEHLLDSVKVGSIYRMILN